MPWIIVAVIARISLVVLFPFSAVDKIVHWNAALQQADSSFLPRASAPPLLMGSIVVELLAPACIIAGWHVRIAALVLAAFCAVTAVLYHSFWKFPDFWSRDGEGRGHFWDFLKNFGLAGGLLLLGIVAGLAPAVPLL
jgi:putative oxidoreductase